MNSYNQYGMCAKCHQPLTNPHTCFQELTLEQKKALDTFREERRKSIDEYLNGKWVMPTATQEQQLQQIKLQGLKKDAYDKLLAAEKAWYAYFCACEVGLERINASDIYDNIRTATRR